MFTVLAFCRNCSTIFRSKSEGTGIEGISKGSELLCAQCGQGAARLEDVARFGEQVGALLADPGAGPDRIRFYYTVAGEAQRTSTSPEEAVEKLREKTPALAEAVMVVGRPRRWFAIGVLLEWLTMLQHLSTTPSVVTVESAFYRAVLKVAKYLSP